MWIFDYKFDKKNWLVKYKIRLITKNEVQNSEFYIFAAALIAHFLILNGFGNCIWP